MSSHRDDVDQITSVFRLYEQKMFHIAFAVLHDPWQAEDAVMEAFVRLLERGYSVDDPASFKTKKLMIQIIRSAAIDLYRKNQREQERRSFSEDPSALVPAQCEAPVLSPDGEVEAMIGELPEIYRDVMFFRYVKEYSTAETAAALGISEEAVRKRHERAIRMMKKNLSVSGNGRCCYGTND